MQWHGVFKATYGLGLLWVLFEFAKGLRVAAFAKSSGVQKRTWMVYFYLAGSIVIPCVRNSSALICKSAAIGRARYTTLFLQLYDFIFTQHQACRIFSAFAGGSLAGGLSLEVLGLPAPVASAIGGTVSAAGFMSARLRAFWHEQFGIRNA